MVSELRDTCVFFSSSLILSESLVSQVAATHSSWSLSSFKWRAHFQELQPHKFPCSFISFFHFHSKTNSKTCLYCFLMFQSVELVCLVFIFGSFIVVVVLVVLIVFPWVLIGSFVLFLVLIGSYDKIWVSMWVWLGYLCFDEFLNDKNIYPILKKCLIIFQLLLNP